MKPVVKHESYMQHALELAGNNPKYPFGAVIVNADGEIIAEGWNRSSINPTWHGEIDAINHLAAARIPEGPLTLYTTAEPCPMCQSAILWTGISLVVFGTSIETLIAQGWKQIDIPCSEVVSRSDLRPCEIIGGVRKNQCDPLFAAAISLKQ